MKKSSIIFLSCAFCFLLVSCTKEGAVGPAGPAGPAGPVGPPGAPGVAGTANVIYSDWFNFKPSDYKDTTLFHLNQYAIRANKLAPSLTAAHLSSAVILSYMAHKPQTSQNWFVSLPYIFDIGSDNFQVNFVPKTGKLIYYWLLNGGEEDLWGSDPNDYFGVGGPYDPSDIYFRYVIIPGGVKANNNVGNSGYSLTELKSMSGNKIQEIFNIPISGSNILFN
jgi:hypothetical protein